MSMFFPDSPRPILQMLLSAVALSLSACANMSGLGGSAEYGCKAPDGVKCDSVSGNYYNSVQNNLPSQRSGRKGGPSIDKAPSSIPQTIPPTDKAISRPASVIPISASVSDTASTVYTPTPLRSQARVLRLWFKPWEDLDHDLYDQGYVYVQIDEGRWLIEHTQRKIRDGYVPVRVPRSASAPESPTGTKADVQRPNATSLEGTSSGPVAGAIKSLQDRARMGTFNDNN